MESWAEPVVPQSDFRSVGISEGVEGETLAG